MNCKKCGKPVDVRDDISRHSQLCSLHVNVAEAEMELLNFEAQKDLIAEDRELNPQYYED